MSESCDRIHIDTTFGAIFLGQTVAAALWGVTLVQTWYYYNRYPKDVWYLKWLVFATMMFDTLHQFLITHAAYWFVVTNYSNPPALLNMVPSILIEVTVTGLTGLLVQGFLTYRCWRLTNRNWFIAFGCFSIVLTEFITSIIYTVVSLRMKTWEDLHRLKAISMSINASGALGSVVIASVLVYNLKKSRTGIKRSDTMISKLIKFAVNTGGLTSICACSSLITILSVPDGLIYMSIYFLLGRLYTNSLLATLNARKSINGIPEDGDHMHLSTSRFLNDLSGMKTLATNNSKSISIKVDTTTVRDTAVGQIVETDVKTSTVSNDAAT